jgi:hypothetical protein
LNRLKARIAPAAANLNVADLTGKNGFKIIGEAGGDESGRSVDRAGDVNGDEIDDLIIGASGADAAGSDSGASYVVFGSRSGFGASLDLSTLDGTNGFKISGEAAGDLLGFSVSGAGDINGDGIDDLAVGALFADANGANSGASYVIFGSAGGFAANLNLSALTGTNGFKISGEAAKDYSGAVSGAGDVNGDGIDDLIIGAGGAGSDAGAGYVIFGSATAFPANLNLSALNGANGFKVNGEAAGDSLGNSVSGAGDVNGDGIDDVIIGAPGADANGADSGATYVIFGSTSGFTAVLDLSTLTGGNGFKISGEHASDISGQSVSGAGDVNGDGIGDVIIGASSADSNGPDSGASFVVFGRANGFAANLNLSDLTGANGFKVIAEARGDNLGHSVGGAGDINADGIDDLIIGAIRADPHGSESGASYVLFGSTRGFAAKIGLSKLSAADGFKISGEAVEDQLGRTVSGAGDINGDGIDDLVVGAPFADSKGTDAGTSYVIFGAPAVQINPSTVVVVEADGDAVTIKLAGGNLFPQDITRDADGNIGTIDLTHLAGAAHAVGAKPFNLIVTAKTPFGGTGNGLAKVGLLNASGLGLGKVKLQGDLDRILAGDGSGKAAAKSLSILGNLGTATGLPQISRLIGAVNKLAVGGSVQKNAVQVDGKVKVITVGGDVIGDFGLGPALLEEIAHLGLDGLIAEGSPVPAGVLLAESIGSLKIGGSFKSGGIVTTKDLGAFSVLKDFSGGLFSDGAMKSLKVLGKMVSEDPNAPTTITARNKLDSLIISGDVENARILVGYSKDEDPVNADARIGKVLVKGNWRASSLVAGIDDSTTDGFGRTTPSSRATAHRPVVSTIASVVIKGTASGSTAPGDHFGITSQRIGKVSIGGTKIPLSKDAPDDLLLDETNNDFRLVELS